MVTERSTSYVVLTRAEELLIPTHGRVVAGCVFSAESHRSVESSFVCVSGRQAAQEGRCHAFALEELNPVAERQVAGQK